MNRQLSTSEPVSDSYYMSSEELYVFSPTTNLIHSLQQAITSHSLKQNGIIMQMNSFDVPFCDDPVLIPDLKLKIKADLSHVTTSFPPCNFWKVFAPSHTFSDVAMQTFMGSIDHLLAPVSELQLRTAGKQIPNETKHERCMLPVGLMNEETAALYLNDIVIAFYHKLRNSNIGNRPPSPPIGYWSGEKHNKLLGVGPFRSKPDLMLLPLQDGYKIPADAVVWPDVLSVGEMTSSDNNTPSLMNQTTSKSFLMLFTQGDRGHVISFLVNAIGFSVKIFDREGIIEFGPMYYHLHTEEFLLLILKLSYDNESMDATMTRLPKTKDNHSGLIMSVHRVSNAPTLAKLPSQSFPMSTPPVLSLQSASFSPLASNLICNIKSIKCENEVYTVIREIFCSQSLTGRATRVWKALDSKNNLVIVKESWILAGQKQTEFNFLQGLDAPQIPKIHTSIRVGLSTAKIRNILAPDLPDKVSKHREKCRIIETPIADPLLMNPAPGQPNSQNGSKHPDVGVRAGTAPFMAIPLLLDPTARHCVAFDLESLVYVFIYFVVQVKGLTTEGAVRRGALPTFIAKWFSRSMALETLGEIKTAEFHAYLEKTLKQVTTPFSSLVPTIRSLWTALYPDHDPNTPPRDCCEEFIAILERAIIAEGSSESGPQAAASPTTSSTSMGDHAEEPASKKRKLGNHVIKETKASSGFI
ncbi:hypothetical protein C0991_010057 [Blastosporella zonata]|nr:hypothetical protein C0991_010057 [Blastosporella zonata]